VRSEPSEGWTGGPSSSYGHDPYAQPNPTVRTPTGQHPTVKPPTGQHPTVTPPTGPGRTPTGQYPTISPPTGQHPTVPPPSGPQPGRPPTGQYPTVPPPATDYPTQLLPSAVGHPPRPAPTGEYLAVRRDEEQSDPPALLTGGREIRSHAATGRERRRHGRSRRGDDLGQRHDAELSVSRRTATIVRWILIPCAAVTAFLVAFLWPDRPETAPSASMPRAYGEVLRITEVPCPDSLPQVGPALPCGTAVVHITSGPGAGTDTTVELPRGPGAPRLSAGDAVVLGELPQPGDGGRRFIVMDHQRGMDLLLMLALCMVAVIAFGRWRGVTALVGLGVSFAFLLLFIIPAILNGQSPLPVAIVGSAAIMFAVLYLTHGFTVTTSVAVLGTLASLVITGLLGALFTATTSLTGFTDEDTINLSIFNNEIDLRGLLLAGIIIGALGVLDDVTVTQATTVAELAPAATSRLALFRSAIRVGRAHVASAVNTIVLAYAGASLPLLLLIAAGGQPVSEVLTSPVLAQEIVRAAVGTIGLVAAVPITTGLATLVADLRRSGEARPAVPEPRRDRTDGAEPRPRPEPERPRSW